MTTYRKIIIVFYLIVVTVVIAFPILDGLGFIALKEGTSWLLTQIVTATAVPVAIAVLKTSDFFKEDPYDAANLKKEHERALIESDTKQKKAIADLVSQHNKRESDLQKEIDKWKKTAWDIQNKPRTIQSRSKLLG
jgi:hypothetical protein